jgi:photosystem II stability/assembly factor-like uncharacterized protein
VAITVLIGTTKGAFTLTYGPGGDWALTGQHCDGWPINHVLGDPETGMIWAGGGGPWHGAGVWRSVDRGATWTLAKLSKGQIDEWAANDPDMSAFMQWTPQEVPFEGLADSVWSLHHAHGILFAGTRPAQLLSSRDDGMTWGKSQSIADFPDCEAWNPGAAGLVLHSITTDPSDADKAWLGISSAGVFATEDGGQSWEPRNRMSNAQAHAHHDHPAAPRGGETGHCIHNLERAAGGTLYQQNHHGVYRSGDDGRSWDDITEGLPSTFGFPVGVHPRDDGTIWVLPLNGDTEGRFPPDASAAVWKTTDGGESWQAKRKGLPQKSCFFTVLRQAMAVDKATPAGVYFGTNAGSIFASRDEGETWDEIARHLPTVLSVEVMLI